MKILLVRLKSYGFPCPNPDMPLGLLYVAAALEKANHTVVLRDLNWQEIEDDIWNEIKTGEIQVVGISMLSMVRSAGYDLCKKIKEINPKVKTVIGGIHATAVGKNIVEKLWYVDACVSGEGESSFAELIYSYGEGEKYYRSGIAGVYDRRFYSNFYCNFDVEFTERGPIPNLDTIPFPAWKHTNFDKFQMTCVNSLKGKIEVVNGIELATARWSPMIASRGCIGKCIFCNAWKHWGNMVRFRSAENILDEVETLYNEHNIRLIAFNDDAFPMKRSQCVEFCEGLIKRNLRIAWQTTTRADMVDDELCKLMKESGCFMVAVGIESGSQKIHDRLNKKLNLDRAMEGMLSIRKSGMVLYPLLMIGNPGETENTIDETIEYLNKAKPYFYSYVSGVMIVPGTELCRMCNIADNYWVEEGKDGLPKYLKENNKEQLRYFSCKIQNGVNVVQDKLIF